jgi:hypothetical protein
LPDEGSAGASPEATDRGQAVTAGTPVATSPSAAPASTPAAGSPGHEVGSSAPSLGATRDPARNAQAGGQAAGGDRPALSIDPLPELKSDTPLAPPDGAPVR